MTDLERLNIAMKCLNKIGDYFEYAYESEQDKKVVMKALSDLLDSFDSKDAS